MPERSLKGKSAVSVLQEDFNDIDIYVEDTAKESKKIYTELLSRVFNGKYKIDNIISLGPCTNVISEWRGNKALSNGRFKVYIIDGDYHNINDSITDLLDEGEHNNHQGLFVLPRYCIENYLIDYDSFVEIIYEEVAEDDRESIIKVLNFENWSSENNQILKDLFIYNSICIKYNVPEKTSKYKISNLLSSNQGICCSTLINSRINYLKMKIKERDNTIDISKEFNERNERMKSRNFISLVTGKDYLFPLIKSYISDQYNCLNMSQISLKIRLSKICDITELYPINDNLI